MSPSSLVKYAALVTSLLSLVAAQNTRIRQLNCSRSPIDPLIDSSLSSSISDEFLCSDGGCINIYNVCDGTKDCLDGSDETYSICKKMKVKCPAYSFRCAYGACVDKNAKCNGITECADNSDELLPECKRSTSAVTKTCLQAEFQCESGQCIDEFSLCDGEMNCDDGSDETIAQCADTKCPKYTYQCLYGACIDHKLKCDGKPDCHDRSDEEDEMCQKDRRAGSPSEVSQGPTALTSNKKQPPKSERCVLPEPIGNGRYQVASCGPSNNSDICQGVPGTNVDPNTVIVITCNNGFSLPDDKNVSFCYSGRWQPSIMDCSKYCKPLVSHFLDISCESGGEPIPCDKPMPPKTKAYLTCKQFYYPPEFGPSSTKIKCENSGEWDDPLLKCLPKCGIPNYNVEEPLISSGQPTVEAEYPWHAGLYKEENGTWNQFCGGSIINAHVILTAAHCVYNGSVIAPESVQVAVGKYWRSWSKKGLYEQRLNVSEIIVERYFRGQASFYSHDIALLDLTSFITFHKYVMPVCLGIYDYNAIPDKSQGTVVGWGLTESQKLSETLKVAKMPYIDHDSCMKLASSFFKRYITTDKFCAAYVNGTGVQMGDSGGAFTFTRQGKEGLHFIHGIVSVKQMNSDFIAAFTNITDHKEWIEETIRMLRKKHNT